MARGLEPGYGHGHMGKCFAELPNECVSWGELFPISFATLVDECVCGAVSEDQERMYG